MNTSLPDPFASRRPSNVTPHIDEWPEACRYYEPGLMDARKSLALLDDDTTYTDNVCPWYLAYTAVNGKSAGVSTREIFVHERNPRSLFDVDLDDCSLLVIHIRCARQHFVTRTSCSLSLTKATWQKLLLHFDILPQFVDLLHNNNGGSFAHTSYNTSSSNTALEDGEPGVRALHVGYKVGVCVRTEVAIYARLDLERNRRLVVAIGSEACVSYPAVSRLLRTRPSTHWLEVVQMLLLACYNTIDGIRNVIDFRTQQHESLTGYASFEFTTKPLGMKELKFDRFLYVTTDMCRGVGYGSDRIRLNCLAFLDHLTKYQDIIAGDSGGARLTPGRLQNIREGCTTIIEQCKHQHDQIMELYTRLLAQADVTKALILQRDTQMTLELTEATKRDSELMRGIAAVTMVFLPATFVATFFSMVFFNVDDDNNNSSGTATWLTVHGNIWLYPIVTVPMTLIIAAWYFAWSFGWVRRIMNGSAAKTVV